MPSIWHLRMEANAGLGESAMWYGEAAGLNNRICDIGACVTCLVAILIVSAIW